MPKNKLRDVQKENQSNRMKMKSDVIKKKRDG